MKRLRTRLIYLSIFTFMAALLLPGLTGFQDRGISGRDCACFLLSQWPQVLVFLGIADGQHSSDIVTSTLVIGMSYALIVFICTAIRALLGASKAIDIWFLVTCLVIFVVPLGDPRGFLIGYYVWAASYLILAVAVSIKLGESKVENPTPETTDHLRTASNEPQSPKSLVDKIDFRALIGRRHSF